jgi:hypothetical protein
MRLVALLSLSLLAACGIPEQGPMMSPGEDCLSCHGAGSNRHWYAAGTVYADPQAKAEDGIQGVQVVITDAKDRKISLKTNGAGNFYTAETLAYPLKSAEVWLNGEMNNKMPDDQQPEGSCNSCHNGDDMPRIFVTR